MKKYFRWLGDMNESKKLLLFDVDGTLTEARKIITDDMIEFINKIKDNENIDIGVVGGSDIVKQREQLDRSWETFDYQFAENGLVAFKDGVFMESNSFAEHLGKNKMKRLINIILGILSKTDSTIKTGLFIEHRTGMLNVSPIGRKCTYDERLEFYEYDKIHKVRDKMKKQLEELFCDDNNIRVSIGGQISMDIFPNGWDKTYCLRFVENDYDEIHFFGDKTHEGGNDHEIYIDKRVIGHCVTNPSDTIKQVNEILNN